MAKVNKRSIPISPKDFKKAVFNANKSLEIKNNNLKIGIKDKEKELKSLEKEYSSKSKEYGKLVEEITFQQERDSKVRGGIYSNEKLLSEKLKLESKAEKEYKDYKNGVFKLEEKEIELLDKIKNLEFYKSKFEESKNELAGIQAKKDNALDELEAVNDNIKLSIDEGKDKVAYYEGQYDALEEQAKKHEDMVHQFEQRLVETQGLFKDEENKLNDLREKSKDELQKSKDELQAIQNLCNNTEDKYLNWEQKVAKAKENADKEEVRIQKAKDNFAKWKIGVLEEVARLKLKNKVDNIDKAGLSDILNG